MVTARLRSVSLLTTFLDYLDTGPIDIFVDEQLSGLTERTIGGQDGPIGLFKGEDMGNTLLAAAPQRLVVELATSTNTSRRPENRSPAGPAVLEQRQHQPPGPDVLLVCTAPPTCRTT